MKARLARLILWVLEELGWVRYHEQTGGYLIPPTVEKTLYDMHVRRNPYRPERPDPGIKERR